MIANSSAVRCNPFAYKSQTPPNNKIVDAGRVMLIIKSRTTGNRAPDADTARYAPINASAQKLSFIILV